MKNKRLCILLCAITLAGFCISCSNTTETSVSGESETSNSMVTQTDNQMTSISQDSTLVTTVASIETDIHIIITPPAERVYPIRNQDAVDIFIAMGLIIKDITPTDEFAETFTAAFDSDYKYYYRYQSFTVEEKAMEEFEAIHTSILEGETDEPFEGTCEITDKGEYKILVSSGNYGGQSPTYWVAILADKALVSGWVFSTDELDKQMINNYFVGLGYM
ncbi:MAG: hypothetical protein GXY43_01760 [Clostridiaceae bacterium]|nr:hypothetical protein [Clostridiaceae bacterium]